MKTKEMLERILEEIKEKNKAQVEIKDLRIKIKKYKKKRQKYLDELTLCQKKRSGHWEKYVYEKARADSFKKTLSSPPYIILKYALIPFSFISLKNHNSAQKLGVVFFGIIARPFMTQNQALKLKKTPREFFRDSRNRTTINIGRILGILDDNQTNNSKYNKTKKPKKIQDIKVALICDEFSYNSFKYEFDPIVIEPNNWKEKFETKLPDIFFCESAWSGIDPEHRPWQGKIYSSINFEHENRRVLLDILAYCKKKSIPTIFWNKEDPTHFDDKVHNFIKTACNFDYIFTTDEDCIPRYKKEYRCKNVFCLPFATQPKLFNPIEKWTRTEKIVFAGSWYKNHKKRSKDMKIIFDNILDSGKKLEIYDRYFDDDDKKHAFPKRFRDYTKPAVGHNEIDRIYKSSIFGLNINTVQKSKTMFSRRVYELASSNTFVISNYSKGVDELLGNNVIFAELDAEQLSTITRDEIDQQRDENLHYVLKEHTYSNRFSYILDSIGYTYIPIDNSITLVCIAKNESDISLIMSFYQKQQYENKKLLIVLSDDIADTKVASIYAKYNKAGVGIIALSYMRTQKKSWDEFIDTRYIAIADFNIKVRNDLLQRTYSHVTYATEIISMRSKPEKKYTYSDEICINNVFAHKNHFKKLLENYNKFLKGDFYHV